MYCGEWIESHALHVFMLHAPDFLGFDVGLDDGARAPRGGRGRPADQGDRQRAAAGDRRPRDPPDQRPGRRLLQGAEPGASCDAGRRAGRGARAGRASRSRWVAGLDFPDFEQDYEFVALRHPDRYAIEDGRLVSGSGLDIGPGEYEEHFAEQHVPHSTALQSPDERRRHLLPRADGALLAELRAALDRGAGGGGARRGWARSAATPSSSIVVRAVEILYAFDEALRLIEAYEPPDPPAVEVEPKAAAGTGWSEAPRGMLWHRYRSTDDGSIAEAQHRSADLAEPGADRAGPARVRRGRASSCPTIACSGSASRRSATTTPASAARPTS